MREKKKNLCVRCTENILVQRVLTSLIPVPGGQQRSINPCEPIMLVLRILKNLILTLNYLMTYCLVCSAVKLLIIKVYQPNIFLYSHSVLSCVLAEFFNLIIHAGYVPSQFGISYTVPLLKCNDGCTKKLSVQDFRGIYISPVLSKVFEHCILHRFSAFLTTSDNQFGFKKYLGCSHAIYCVPNIVNHYVSRRAVRRRAAAADILLTPPPPIVTDRRAAFFHS